jgi:uncharacterized protein (DUF4415 family)
MSRKDLNSTSGTNWAALESRSEENIDYSDIPPLTEEFFERSTLRIPADQAHNLVQLDPDVKQWFQAQGEQYKTLINNVLRQYRTHLRSFSDRPRLAIGSATGDRLSYWRSAFNCAMFEGQPKLGRVVGCP